jgi:threo-3-hydroxy-L-aspartate ammonia-lyase
MSPLPLHFSDVQAAAERLKGVAHHTPVIRSRTLDQLLGCEVFMKAENLQRGGAFKFRGAYNAIKALTDAERARGICAFSSGNHAQAVALSSRLLGCKAVIIMPADTPQLKLDGTRGYGAEVITYNRYTESREGIAAKVVNERGMVLIPPYDHVQVMAGQGTAALELLEDMPELDALIVCTSGGGFLAGSAVAAKAIKPNIKVYGSEPELGNDTKLSLDAGYPIAIPVPNTICDGQQTPQPGDLTFAVNKALVTDILLTPDAQVLAAMKFLFERVKLVVEPSGASALSALMSHAALFKGQRVGITLSGGNIDIKRFISLMHGI